MPADTPSTLDYSGQHHMLHHIIEIPMHHCQDCHFATEEATKEFTPVYSSGH
jgi:hypothetical protein